MLTYLSVGLGGALGAMMRLGISHLLPLTLGRFLPFPILAINISGCFMMGFLTALFASFWPLPPTVKIFLTTGFLGGFTTFSTFALETALLIERGLFLYATLYIVTSTLLSIAAFFMGLKAVAMIS